MRRNPRPRFVAQAGGLRYGARRRLRDGKSVSRQLIRGFRHELKPRAEAARDLAPQPRAMLQVQHLVRGFLQEPRGRRNLRLDLARTPARVTHERAHHRHLRRRLLRLGDHQMMPALHPLRFRAPMKRRENELIRGHRPAEEDRHAREPAEIAIRQKLRHRAARGAVQREPERAIRHAVRREKEHGFGKTRIAQIGVRDEQRAGQADRRRAGFAHAGSLEFGTESASPSRPSFRVSRRRPLLGSAPDMPSTATPLTIAGREFRSRLLLGTGKFSSHAMMAGALDASGCEIVTVALRRADLSGKGDPFANILDFIDPKKYLLLPNTSGAMNAEEAVRLARLAAAAGLPKWVKLEIHPDPRYLLPDPIETLKAAEILVREGFTVLPYINADPVLAKRLQDAGTATVMPLGSPIGSNRGLETRAQLAIIIEQATVPVVVDAGLGAPSQAAEALEMGADAVLVNTAIAIASDPARMARAFKTAVEAGREAFEIGLADRLDAASATSPLAAFLQSA